MTTGPAHWELLARARAIDNQCYVAVVSPARDVTADYVAWGHSLVVNPWYIIHTISKLSLRILYITCSYSFIDVFQCSCTQRGATPFLPFLLPCPFTSSSFALFLLFAFSHSLYLFSSFVHPFPFYRNSHHSVSRPEVVGGNETWV